MASRRPRSVGGSYQPGEMGGGAARGGPGLAEPEQGAGAAFTVLVDGGRRAPGSHHGANGGHEAQGLGAERGVEGHVLAATSFPVEERADRNGDAEHFLEAKGLGAELHGVDGRELGPAALVFDREWNPGAVGPAVKLDDVGRPVQAVRGGLQSKAAGDAEAGAGFGAGLVGALVKDATLGG